ncbi:polysaccharide biosynthesis protein [Edaphobacter bradus]|uniref:polysaccharide biosynthesis protein n=1 Tax=Edaphobacter bradus TaxID=2259016 RepID=UPI0021E0DCC7|nr:nucleoside-diphosphate sugar epimerase/dehydratase [Edaphobacter bradus]
MTSLLNYRKTLILTSQIFLLAMSYYGSFMLRFDFRPEVSYQLLFVRTLPVVLAAELLAFYTFGLLRGWWRYAGMSDALDICEATFASAVILYLLIEVVLRVDGYPRSVLAINLVLTVLVVGGTRFAVRAYTEGAQHSAAELNTLIVGAGRAGSTIARELKRNSGLNLKPVGFVDDDPSKHGIRIHGLKVLGSTDCMSEILSRMNIRCVLIAIPSARGSQVEQIIAKCRQCKVDFKILPSLSRHVNGGVSSIADLRNARPEDLLGRQPVQIDLASIRRQLEGKVLLITGAGGSIGAELSRQVCDFAPRELIVVDRSENCLFNLGLDLGTNRPQQHFIPVIADIQDVGAMREIFALHRPDMVFHAAAYKHVPLMEQSCFQAVTNNIFGTYNVALVARQFGCKAFVMISSDKAVNPTNVMGVTKRIAELIILGLQHEHTRYVAVRFGNVLGSNGSVVPIFQQQIAGGGPVTVTHPEAKRYFMTIPEAVQLVLQASTMGVASDIFVLEMGQQIRIADLARNLIRLSGLEPDRDIPVIYTGLRPGEKLFEELMLDGEGMKPTSHPKIRVLDGGPISFEQVHLWLDELSALVEAKNVYGLVQTFQRIVPEYKPSNELLAMSEVDRHDMALKYRRARGQLWHSVDSMPNVPTEHLVMPKRNYEQPH